MGPAVWPDRFAAVASMLTCSVGQQLQLPVTQPGQRVAHGDRAKENGTMTPQQKALIAELLAADYPATWKLSASAADQKLAASATQFQAPARA